MSQQTEIEFKSLLSKEGYKRIYAYYQLQPGDFHIQTNDYFDTESQALASNNCGLRIRGYENYGELTLKTPEQKGRLETTDRLSLEQLRQGKVLREGAVARKLSQYGLAPADLKLTARLTTKRAEFEVREGLLALDENWYEGHHDYELELEVDAATGFDSFQKLLTQFELEYQPSENKVARAVKAARQKAEESKS